MFIYIYMRDIIYNNVTCEAIEEEANAFAVRGADEIAVAEERKVTLVEGNGGEVESCISNGEK